MITLCKIRSCNANVQFAAGMCFEHYRTRCVVDNCYEEITNQELGLCAKHYKIAKGYPLHICVVNDCDKTVYAKSMCKSHYSAQHRWETIRPCSV